MGRPTTGTTPRERETNEAFPSQRCGTTGNLGLDVTHLLECVLSGAVGAVVVVFLTRPAPKPGKAVSLEVSVGQPVEQEKPEHGQSK